MNRNTKVFELLTPFDGSGEYTSSVYLTDLDFSGGTDQRNRPTGEHTRIEHRLLC